MSIKAHSDFVCAGGNRHPAAADWDCDGSGLLAYGANNNIALWQPSNPARHGVITLLSGHSDAVNAVKFLRPRVGEESLLLSGSADKSIRVWKSSSHPDDTSYHSIQLLTEHENAINCIAVAPSQDVFVSGSADATIKVWKLGEHKDGSLTPISLIQSISTRPKFFPLSLSLYPLDGSSLVLAVAGTKSTIQLFVSKDEDFERVAELAGHEGWIRSLTFIREAEDHESDLILASASQDKYIRLWRLHKGEELPAASGAASDPALGMLGKSLSIKAHRFTTSDSKYSVTFDALLLGHEDWIYSARWLHNNGILQLLSASADNSVAIWQRDSTSGVWVCTTRLGELSAQKGATTATGSAGGFWIALWSPDGTAVASLGRTGGWRLWDRGSREDQWSQQSAIGGHTKEVKGLAWSKDGSYLLTTSSDQTTRQYAEWLRYGISSWHELSRPQIHGYDLNCIDSLNGDRFISGADEKLLRVFDKPKAVAKLLNQLAGDTKSSTDALPDSANIPVLGLSNKAIEATSNGEEFTSGEAAAQELDLALEAQAAAAESDHPPFEGQLSRHLLWPEVEKVYGHGYEIAAVASSANGRLVATACRATSIDHAVIRLYETKEWRESKPPLALHTLTVTSLEFSDDDQYLLSVGRDRQWAIFKRDEDASRSYGLALSDPKGHARMILDCSWARSRFGRIFATAGRDKNVKVWRMEGDSAKCVTSLSSKSAVTSVAFLQSKHHGSLVLAHGTEDGAVTVTVLDKEAMSIASSHYLNSSLLPSSSINSLAWRPSRVDQSTMPHGSGGEGEEVTSAQLAVAGADGSVRILRLALS